METEYFIQGRVPANHGIAENLGFISAQAEIRNRYLRLLFHLQVKHQSESNAPNIDKGVQNQIHV
jgi:hypothetical protein